jgi:polar amino acid transport system substrate-binding protein
MVMLLALIGAALLIGGCKKKAEAGAVQQTVSKAATAGMPRPFSYVNDSGELVGHNIELIKAVFDRLPQYKLEIEVTDFPSIFAGMDSGRYQIGINNFVMNDERKEKYLFSDPMFANSYVAVVQESNNQYGDAIDTLGVFAGKTSSGQVGNNISTAIENYNKANPGAEIIRSYTDADMLVVLQDVEQGKTDFDLIDKPLYQFYMQSFPLKLKSIELSDTVAANISQRLFSYILISKGYEQLTQDVNKALREVIADGTSKRINEKYFGEDFSPKLE